MKVNLLFDCLFCSSMIWNYEANKLQYLCVSQIFVKYSKICKNKKSVKMTKKYSISCKNIIFFHFSRQEYSIYMYIKSILYNYYVIFLLIEILYYYKNLIPLLSPINILLWLNFLPELLCSSVWASS